MWATKRKFFSGVEIVKRQRTAWHFYCCLDGRDQLDIGFC